MKYLPWVIRLTCCAAMGVATKAAGITVHKPEFWIILVAFFVYGDVRERQGKGKL